jgi:hypothetical protein
MFRIMTISLGLLVLAGCSKDVAQPSNAAPGKEVEHGVPQSRAHGAPGTESQMNQHAKHEMPALHQHSAAESKLVLQNKPDEFRAGQAVELRGTIQNNTEIVKRFDETHEKPLHLIVVRDDLDHFQHIHPEVDAEGQIRVSITFPVGGLYRLYADHKPHGGTAGVATAEVRVAGDVPTAKELVSNVPSRVKTEDIQSEVLISEPQPGGERTLKFSLLDQNGSPITNLQSYLGAMGHLVIISKDGADYVHAHTETVTAPDGKVAFMAHFQKTGIYKAWGQFQREGHVYVVPCVLNLK